MIAGTGETFDEMSADGPIESYADDLLALRSVKISSDGALGSRGAALLEDYSDDSGNKGLLFLRPGRAEPDALQRSIKWISDEYSRNW